MTITRMRNGKLEVFREGAYKLSPRAEKVKANLVENFGYGKYEARDLAVQICNNIDSHIARVESSMRRVVAQTPVGQPTQTPYWKANNGNVRV